MIKRGHGFSIRLRLFAHPHLISKRRVRKDWGPPVVIKVTVSKGQARVYIPKKTAVRLNLMNEEGEPSSVTHLLVTAHRTRVSLHPVEVPDVEAE